MIKERTMTTEHDLDLAIAAKEEVAKDVCRLTLHRPDGGELPAWEPGAHIDLVLSDDLVRQYSLCGDPADRSTLQVAVLREVDGRGGSAVVHDTLRVGDTVRVRGPRNHFALEEVARYIFVAGGIGITPLLPMIRQVAGSGTPWRLAYGGRSRASMAFHQDLLAAHPDHVTVHPADEVGLLDLPTILGEPGASAEDVKVYCCGPEPLLAAVERECARWPQGALHVERFAPKAGALDRPNISFEVELKNSGKTLEVPADRSILEVVSDAGIHVLSSCEEGTCGTCETGVLDGVPDHRDSVLTEDERTQNGAMMICVSRACSRRLVLEL
jgi:ferredoxin-NADP reductase